MTTDSVAPFLDRAANAAEVATLQATHAAQRGVAAIHETSEHLLDRARDVSDRTSSYVRHEPIKALLLAAAAGATLVAALSVLLRANSR